MRSIGKDFGGLQDVTRWECRRCMSKALGRKRLSKHVPRNRSWAEWRQSDDASTRLGQRWTDRPADGNGPLKSTRTATINGRRSAWLPAWLPLVVTWSICSHSSPSLHPHLSTKTAIFRAIHITQKTTLETIEKLENTFPKVVQQHYVDEMGKSILCCTLSRFIFCAKYCRNRL